MELLTDNFLRRFYRRPNKICILLVTLDKLVPMEQSIQQKQSNFPNYHDDKSKTSLQPFTNINLSQVFGDYKLGGGGVQGQG